MRFSVAGFQDNQKFHGLRKSLHFCPVLAFLAISCKKNNHAALIMPGERMTLFCSSQTFSLIIAALPAPPELNGAICINRLGKNTRGQRAGPSGTHDVE